MQKRGTFNEEPAARMLFCLAEPFFEPASHFGTTCLYTIFSIRTPISQLLGNKSNKKLIFFLISGPWTVDLAIFDLKFGFYVKFPP